ncbi:MAG: hemerythrin domain-containing protein [Chloroflexi bacterium]|nr:hemerythrin domain-containing protein [Chloroflexota bacterium]
MKITDALRGEHGVFYAQFTLMQNTVDAATLNTIQTQGAMLAVALGSHAQIEDEILFPALEAEIGEHGPTRVMREEHVHIEELLMQLQLRQLPQLQTVRELTQAHDDIEGKLAQLPDVTSVDDARTMVYDLLYAAREHFAKEENVLFPLAEQLLSARALEELGAQWAERRGVVLA